MFLLAGNSNFDHIIFEIQDSYFDMSLMKVNRFYEIMRDVYQSGHSEPKY